MAVCPTAAGKTIKRFCQLPGAKDPDPCLVGPSLHSRPGPRTHVTLSAAKGLDVPRSARPARLFAAFVVIVRTGAEWTRSGAPCGRPRPPLTTEGDNSCRDKGWMRGRGGALCSSSWHPDSPGFRQARWSRCDEDKP